MLLKTILATVVGLYLLHRSYELLVRGRARIEGWFPDHRRENDER
jgi:hypothetical protein